MLYHTLQGVTLCQGPFEGIHFLFSASVPVTEAPRSQEHITVTKYESTTSDDDERSAKAAKVR